MRTLLKQYFRNLKRNLLTSFITIAGFSISIGVIIVLFFFIIGELSYDKGFKNIDNTYMVVTTKNEPYVEEDAKDIIMAKYPQVEMACRYYNYQTQFVYNHAEFACQLVTTDEGFFDVFSVPFIYGDKKTVYSNIQGIVLTESLAKTVFKDKYPVGQFIRTVRGKEYQVSAVVKDLPKNSSIKANCFIHYKSKISSSVINNVSTNKLFIVIKPGTNLIDLEQGISKTLIGSSKILNNKEFVFGEPIEWKLFPFKNAYFETSMENDQLQHANLKLILIISFISFLILILAIVNYINLSTAAVISRIKEIGIRKATGAFKTNIFIQFLAESLLTCILASSLAFLFAHALIPVFEILLGKPVDFLMLTLLNVIIILAGVLLIGILSGTIPALIATNYSTIQILSKNKLFLKKPFFKNGLTTFQFIISIVMIFSVFTILKQLTLLQNRDIGFDTGCLIDVEYPGNMSKTDVIKEQLTKNPNIINVSFTKGSPMGIGTYSGSNKPIKNIAILSADEKFVETFNIKILHGRNINYPSKIKECLITENAFKESGWENLDGKRYIDHDVVGIVNTFNNDDLRKFPANIMIQNDTERGFSEVAIRISSLNKQETLRFIKQIWDSNFPDYGFRYTFYDEWVKNMFSKEKNDARIALVFGIFSIILSCLGLFGLAEYSIKNKIKEIGIRKVNGARVTEILAMLNAGFIKWVAIAFVVACPIAWYAMHQWLQNFAYKTELSWWVFAMAGVVAMLVAVLTVSWQSYRAATRNPVESLRYE